MSFTESMQTIVKENENGLLSAHSTWERVRLVDVCKILNGFAFPSSQFAASTGVPLLRIRDVTKDTTQTNFAGEYDPQYLVETGDLVMGMDGDFNAALWRGPRALLNQRVCRLTLDEKFYSKRFLAYAIQGYLNAINAKTSAITVKHLSSRTVAEIPLPLPPLAEQNAVVALLDAMMTRLDAAVASLEQIQKNLKRYRASVLKAAVEGRLVPTEAELARKEGREYEPASELLKCILVKRRKKWIENAAEKARAKAEEKARKAGKPWTHEDDVKTLERERIKAAKKYKEPAVPDTSNLPDLPEGWCWASLDQVALRITKGSSPKWQGFDYCEDGIQFVRSQNVGWGRLNLSSLAHLPRAFNLKEPRSVLVENDVLLNIVGASIGRSAVATPALAGANTNQAVAIIRLLAHDCIPDFVVAYLICPDTQRQIAVRQVEVARPNLSLGDVAGLPLPLPPRDEQKRISLRVQAALTLAERLETETSRTTIRLGKLRQSILKWAFEGKLVEQDPNDEPASVLLERIKAERESMQPRKRRRTNRQKKNEPTKHDGQLDLLGGNNK